MANFKQAFNYMMDDEDAQRLGKVVHDSDGRTRFGILESSHPELTPEGFFDGMDHDDALALAETVYEADYWDRIHGGDLTDQVSASKLLDMAVNFGTHAACIYAQRAVNHGVHILTEDGVLGPQSLAAINAADPVSYAQILCEWCVWHYQRTEAAHPDKAADDKGWMRRAHRLPARSDVAHA